MCDSNRDDQKFNGEIRERHKEKGTRPKSSLMVRATEHQMLNSAEFKTAIINMLKEQKETMFKELKEGTMTMSLEIEDGNEKIEIVQNRQMKIFKLICTITEKKIYQRSKTVDWSWQKTQN